MLPPLDPFAFRSNAQDVAVAGSNIWFDMARIEDRISR
jgi:hypothetical protein